MAEFLGGLLAADPDITRELTDDDRKDASVRLGLDLMDYRTLQDIAKHLDFEMPTLTEVSGYTYDDEQISLDGCLDGLPDSLRKQFEQ